MKKLNETAIATAIRAASVSLGRQEGEKARFQALVLELQGLFGDSDRETIKAYVCAYVAKRGEFTDGQWASTAGTSKKRANRIIAAIMGKADSKKVAVDKALVKQVAALLKGLDAKTLNATIAAVKASV